MFVYLVVRRKLIQAIRGSRYEKHAILSGSESLSRPVGDPDDLVELGDLLGDGDSDPAELLIRREELAAVARARATLSTRERIALDLASRDASLAEIQAEIGGVPTVWGPSASPWAARDAPLQIGRERA
jgi:DNA-directed RNA polymerase specialized sigma24 family protein